jgi:hypothetical protein
MNTIVYVDPDTAKSLTEQLAEVSHKMHAARSEAKREEYERIRSNCLYHLSQLKLHLNPKFIEEMIIDLEHDIRYLKEVATKFKAGFVADPMTFLEYHQIDFVVATEKSWILVNLLNDVRKVQDNHHGLNNQLPKLLDIFETYHLQMTNKMNHWLVNPYNSSSQETNLVHSAQVKARASLAGEMGEFKCKRMEVKKALDYLRDNPLPTECPPVQAQKSS